MVNMQAIQRRVFEKINTEDMIDWAEDMEFERLKDGCND